MLGLRADQLAAKLIEIVVPGEKYDTMSPVANVLAKRTILEPTMRTLLSTLLGLVVVAGVSGCAHHTIPVAPERQLTAVERNFDTLWEASKEVLRKYNFQVMWNAAQMAKATSRAITVASQSAWMWAAGCRKSHTTHRQCGATICRSCPRPLKIRTRFCSSIPTRLMEILTML